jgi:hypothetical protein
MQREIPHLHILDHASSKRCHGKFLFETEFAAKSSPMRSQRRLGGLRLKSDRDRCYLPAAIESASRCIPRSGLVQKQL